MLEAIELQEVRDSRPEDIKKTIDAGGNSGNLALWPGLSWSRMKRKNTMKQHVKTVRTVRVRSARIPDISWVALLNEVGPLVESVPPGIAGELKAAEERLMNAVAEYEAATAYLAGEAGECLKTGSGVVESRRDSGRAGRVLFDRRGAVPR